MSEQVLDEALAQAAETSARGSLAAPNGVTPETARPTKTWMEEQEAEALASRIRQDGLTHGYPISARVVQDQGVFLVRVLWGKTAMTMAYQEAWTRHFTQVHAFVQQQRQTPEGDNNIHVLRAQGRDQQERK